MWPYQGAHKSQTFSKGISQKLSVICDCSCSGKSGIVRLSCLLASEIFPDQVLNLCPLHWPADTQPLDHQGSPIFLLLHPSSWNWIRPNAHQKRSVPLSSTSVRPLLGAFLWIFPNPVRAYFKISWSHLTLNFSRMAKYIWIRGDSSKFSLSFTRKIQVQALATQMYARTIFIWQKLSVWRQRMY